MGTGWRKAKTVLGLNACTSAPPDVEENEESAARQADLGSRCPTPARNVPGITPDTASFSCIPLSPVLPPRSPSRLNLIRTSIRLSRSTCAICLETMKPGVGHALFTAECSHTFHFSCIASNVRHGNLVCPVCRSKWKEVPWQAPPESPKEHHGGGSRTRHRTPQRSPHRMEVTAIEESPLEVEEERRRLDPVLRILDESIANARGVRRTSPPEPSMFDDDEPPDVAPRDNSPDQVHERRAGNIGARESASREDGSTVNVEGPSQPKAEDKGRKESDPGAQIEGVKGPGNLELTTFTEVGAVEYTEARDSFIVLLHLKAPAATQQPRYGESLSPLGLSPLREGMKESEFSFDSPSPTRLIEQSSRAPLDLVTVLDISGSMAGTKLVLLKRAMGFVIRNLSPVDRLSVVAFSSTAKRLFPLRRMVEDGRQLALRAIDALVSTGGTNIAEGLRKGAKVLADRVTRNPVASIMLLSDGQDTYTMGTRVHVSIPHRTGSEYRRLLPGSIRHSRRSGQTPIPVHTFGFGSDHDASTMHSIAEVSGGTFSFIQAEGVVQDAFAQCIGGLLSVVVQDSQLVINSGSPGVEVKSIGAGSYENGIRESASEGFVKLGDMYAEEERDILLELRLPALERVPSGTTHLGTLLRVGCSYKDPVLQEVKQMPVQEVCIQRPEQVEREQEIVSIEVDRQRNRLRTAQTIVEAGSLADTGDIAAAQLILQSAKSALQSSVASQVGDQLTNALEVELTEIQVRMANRQMYERSGRAYVLSAQSSHFQQRATTRGSFVDSQSRDYQTPSMVDMILRSQTLSPQHSASASGSSTPSFTPNLTPTRESRHGRLRSGHTGVFPSPSRMLMRRTSGRVGDSHSRADSFSPASPCFSLRFVKIVSSWVMCNWQLVVRGYWCRCYPLSTHLKGSDSKTPPPLIRPTQPVLGKS